MLLSGASCLSRARSQTHRHHGPRCHTSQRAGPETWPLRSRVDAPHRPSAAGSLMTPWAPGRQVGRGSGGPRARNLYAAIRSSHRQVRRNVVGRTLVQDLCPTRATYSAAVQWAAGAYDQSGERGHAPALQKPVGWGNGLDTRVSEELPLGPLSALGHPFEDASSCRLRSIRTPPYGLAGRMSVRSFSP